MSKPDMLNYFDSPNKSIDGNDDALVIGGTVNANEHILTADQFRKSLLVWNAHGIYDYNDAATSTTPISVTGGVKSVLTNDGLGEFTNIDYGIEGIDNIFDTDTNAFDFSSLSLGDVVSIRCDLVVTTQVNYQDFYIELDLAQGSPTNYQIKWSPNVLYKTQGSYSFVSYNQIYMGNTETIENSAQFKISSDDNASVVVNGWFVDVRRRLF